MHLLPQYSLVNEPLIELTNPGASGSLFYLTSDDEFIIKTVQHKEAKFLQRLLPGYYMVTILILSAFLLLHPTHVCIQLGFSYNLTAGINDFIRLLSGNYQLQ